MYRMFIRDVYKRQGHFCGAGFKGRTADRVAGVEMIVIDAREAQALQIVDDLGTPDRIDDLLQCLDRRRIQRLPNSLLQRDIAAVLAVEVVDDFLRAAVNDRPVGDDVIGGPAQVFKGQRVGQERLDRGAGLFKLADRPVQQPRSGIIPAAPQAADLTGCLLYTS